MIFTLYDEKKTEVLSTTNMDYTLKFLADRIPMKYMCDKDQLQKAIDFDIEHKKPFTLIGFYINDEENAICKLRIDYDK